MATKKSPTPIKKKQLPWNERNPILYIIDGIPIRRVNLITVYLPEHQMAKTARALKGSALSIAKALSLSSKPCDCCKDKTIEHDYRGKIIIIPRGLMYVPKMSSGPVARKKNKQVKKK